LDNGVSFLVLRKGVVKDDWKLALPEEQNNGRKHVVTQPWSDRERTATLSEWAPGAVYTGTPLTDGEKTPVLTTGPGGIEIATCDERAGQDRHLHRLGTECYTVLEGTLHILINDEGPVELHAGDELVVLPGTVHQVARTSDPFLVRVHATRCYGDDDKYVQLARDGDWLSWSSLSRHDRQRAYRKPPR
jgi:quercetin dioxygenase-like cupin family protein